MNLQIGNRKALVVGASKGLGKAIALQLAQAGCHLTLVARNEQQLRAVADEVAQKNPQGQHSIFAVDLMDKAARSHFLQTLSSQHFDICVQNLGGTANVREALCPFDDLVKVFDLNVGVAMDINRILIPKMQKQKWGRIVHISSNSAIKLVGSAPYGIAKATLNAYIQKVGPQFATDNVLISGVMPGPLGGEGSIWTERLKNNPVETQKYINENLPLKRFQEPEEIAEIVLKLCTDSTNHSAGQVLLTDGSPG